MATRGGVTGTDRATRGVNGTAHNANGAARAGKMPSRVANGNGTSSAPDRGRSHLESRETCCAKYHRAIEMVGKRWSGAILLVLLENRGQVPMHLHEEAREHGWSNEQLLEALGHVALGDFSALVTLAGEVPLEGTSREVKPLGKAA